MLAFCFSLLCGTAHAAGYGVTLAGSYGGSWIGGANLDTGEIGFATKLGSTTRRESLRLDVAYVRGAIKEEVMGLGYKTTNPFEGLALTGTVALPVLRKPTYQLWVGPAIYVDALHFRDGDGESYGYGVGFTVGADIHSGQRPQTLVVEAGLRHVCLDSNGNSNSSQDADEDLDHDVVEFLLRTSLLWGH